MPKDNSALPHTEMRRTDRQVNDDAWIKALLHRAPVCTLATVYEDQPFMNSNLFVYDENEQVIYIHTAQAGRTHTNINMNKKVCFSVHEMGRLLPAKEAMKFSVEYASVVVFGSAVCIEDEQQATNALHLLLDKYAPHLQRGQDYRAVVPEELKYTSVYCITIEEWSGKQKKVAEDFPGAYHYENIVN